MFNKKKYKHIIWDWNGTLLNDGWLFVDVMNTILKQRNLNQITLNDYREFFCFPVKEYYIKLGFDLDSEPFEKVGLEFINVYKNRRYDAELYPGVRSLLNGLGQIGINHSILSAQHQNLLDDSLKYYNIQSQFLLIVGLDNHYADSKIQNGINLIKQLNYNLENILLIGDTAHDFDVAQEIGVDSILLSHGHYSYSRLVQTDSMIVNNIIDLSNLFNISINGLYPN